MKVTRRQLLGAATAAPVLAASDAAAEQANAPPGGAPPAAAPAEELEFVQKLASFDKAPNGVTFHCTTSKNRSVDVFLTVCAPDIMRFRLCPDPELRDIKSLLEIKEDWPAVPFQVSEQPDAVTIDTGALRFEVQKDPWKYVVHDPHGEIILQEHVRDVDAQGTFRSMPLGFTTSREGKFLRSNETFYIAPGESFFGLGEQFCRLNRLGQTLDGWYVNPWGSGTHDVHKPILFVMSSRGYGIFTNTTYRVKHYVGSQSLMAYTILVDDPRLDLWIFYGPSLKHVLASYEEVTGWPSLPPKKSFGIWGSPGTREVKDVVAAGKKFRELDIPVDFFPMLVTLPFGRNSNHQQALARTRELSAELDKIGIKMGIYVYPLLALGSEMEQEARANGYALTRADGSPYEAHLINDAARIWEYSPESVARTDAWRNRFYASNRGLCLLVDFTNPSAVRWWQNKIGEYIKAGVWAVGMSDYCEDNPVDAHYHNGRTGAEMHNLYALLSQKASYEAVAEFSGHRGLINARSGISGLQRYSICWSGDPNCEWEDMANSMRAGLSLGLSGVPFWSCDTPGYSSSQGHLTPELWMRWSQWGLFQSNTRLMGNGPRNPWAAGEKVADNFRKYAKLRYRLLPYIYSHAWQAIKTGMPLMRAMVLEFQDDPLTYNLEDQYMFGDVFLVAPVCTPSNKRTVYLPAGTWYDYYTGKEFNGPTLLRIEPPLETLPLYVRAESMIPMGPDMAYVGEKPFNPVTLDIWLTSRAECTLYDDDESARTEEIIPCRAEKSGNEITLHVAPSAKTYIAKLNRTRRPASVTLNGRRLLRASSEADLENAPSGWYSDSNSMVVLAKFPGAGRANTVVVR